MTTSPPDTATVPAEPGPVEPAPAEPAPAEPAPGEPAPAAPTQLAAPTPASAPTPSPWLVRAEQAWAMFQTWIVRPRVRLSVIGGLLLIMGALIVTSSVWTLPLLIVGSLMVAIAWMGSRLEGHIAVAWGQDGTELTFNARVKPVPAALPAIATTTDAAAASAALTAASELPDVVEGTGHTVEIAVSELRALLAAAESPATDEIQVRRLEHQERSPTPAGPERT